MKFKKILKFILCVFGPIICGTIVSLLISTSSYKTMNKPFLSPPPIVFPIVWSILYLLMGISLYLIFKNNFNKKTLLLFLIQLVINFLWMPIFFTYKLYYFAVVWLLLLIAVTIWMIVDFYNIKKIAGYLQFPYFIWLIIALYLNIGVAILN